MKKILIFLVILVSIISCAPQKNKTHSTGSFMDAVKKADAIVIVEATNFMQVVENELNIDPELRFFSSSFTNREKIYNTYFFNESKSVFQPGKINIHNFRRKIDFIKSHTRFDTVLVENEKKRLLKYHDYFNDFQIGLGAEKYIYPHAEILYIKPEYISRRLPLSGMAIKVLGNTIGNRRKLPEIQYGDTLIVALKKLKENNILSGKYVTVEEIPDKRTFVPFEDCVSYLRIKGDKCYGEIINSGSIQEIPVRYIVSRINKIKDNEGDKLSESVLKYINTSDDSNRVRAISECKTLVNKGQDTIAFEMLRKKHNDYPFDSEIGKLYFDVSVKLNNHSVSDSLLFWLYKLKLPQKGVFDSDFPEFSFVCEYLLKLSKFKKFEKFYYSEGFAESSSHDERMIDIGIAYYNYGIIDKADSIHNKIFDEVTECKGNLLNHLFKVSKTTEIDFLLFEKMGNINDNKRRQIRYIKKLLIASQYKDYVLSRISGLLFDNIYYVKDEALLEEFLLEFCKIENLGNETFNDIIESYYGHYYNKYFTEKLIRTYIKCNSDANCSELKDVLEKNN